MTNIVLDKIGKGEGDEKGWFIKIVYDSDKTGGYYVFRFKASDKKLENQKPRNICLTNLDSRYP